jgi:hypothetical protein
MTIEEKDDGTYISVETPVAEDPTAERDVHRELDRIFFLTCVRVRAEMCRTTVTSDLVCNYRIHGHLPQYIQPQSWTSKPELALQLRLWSVADDTNDPPARLLIFFQIVELAFPETRDDAHYPAYKDVSIPPHPRTEAKLLRNLVAHAGKPTNPQTETYIKFLGLEEMLSNRSDPEYLRVIGEKAEHVKSEARKAIESAL